MSAPANGLLAAAPPERGHYLSPEESARFYAKVREGANEMGCWAWTGATVHGGGGVFALRGRTVAARHVAWRDVGHELEDGDRLFATTCDNGWCCNPDHQERRERKVGKPGSWVAGEGPIERTPRAPRRPAPEAQPAVPATVAVFPTSRDLLVDSPTEGCACATCRFLDQPGAASIRFPGGATVIAPDGQAHQGDTLDEAIGFAAGVTR